MFAVALLAGMAGASAQTEDALQLNGTVVDTVTRFVYLQKFKNKVFTTVDSARVEGGKFNFKTRMKLPELYGLSIDTSRTPLYIFLEKSPINVNLSPARNYSKSTVQGSASQDLFETYKKTPNIDISKFITENPKSIVAAYVLYRNWSYRLSPDQINQNIALLDKSLANVSYVTELHELVRVLDGLAIGKIAPDFSAKDVNGKLLSLSENLKGYTLVDFWAAWCGPCRKENPNIVAAYNQYHAKGFNIIGVSLDKDKASWVKAIKDDGLNWTQISELTYWKSEAAKLYGVRAIPANFLLDEKGNIVAKNLRGEQLHQKLAELLGQAK